MTRWSACGPGFLVTIFRCCGRTAPIGVSRRAPSCLSPMSSKPMRYDALVIGAGPAGAVAARLLAKAGWHVALVEKAGFPRRKVCGEFISAATLPILEACGIGDAFFANAGPPVARVGI